MAHVAALTVKGVLAIPDIGNSQKKRYPAFSPLISEHLRWIVAFVCKRLERISANQSNSTKSMVNAYSAWESYLHEPEKMKSSCSSFVQFRRSKCKTKKTYLAFSLKFQNLQEFFESYEYSRRSLDLKIWKFWSQIQKVNIFNELVRAVPTTKIEKQKKPIWDLRWTFRIFWNFWNRMSSLWDLWIRNFEIFWSQIQKDNNF